MAIAKRPNSAQSDSAQANAFIAAGGSPALNGEKRRSAVIRFDAALLRRVDAAAKKRGISRAAWLQFVASHALDAGDL
jgi:hypothetical protein